MNIGELAVIFGLKPQGWEQGNKLIEGLARKARLLIGGEAVRGIVHLVERTTEAATHLVSLGTAMGLTVEQTAEWGYVAQQSGSNLKELSVGMNMFLRNVREVQHGRGGKSLKEMFTQLGLDAEQQKKIFSGSQGLNDTLLLMSDRVKAIGEKSKPLEATFTKVFGVRAGRAMLADFAGGSERINELMARRREMGELSTEQAMSLRDLGNRMKDLKTALSALASQVIAKLAPAFLKMAEAAGKWISENRDLISGALLGALKAVALAFQTIAAGISYVSDLIRSALAGDKGAIALVVGLAAAILSILVPALYAMAVPIVAALAPLAGIAAIVAAITYALLKWGPAIKKGIGDALGWVARTWHEFWSWVTSLPGRFVDVMAEFGQAIIDGFKHALDFVVNEAKAAFNKISELARDIPILGWLGEKIGQGAGFVARKVGGGGEDDLLTKHGGAIDKIVTGSATANATPTNSNVTVGPTSITINVDSVEKAKQAKEAFDERRDADIRHAQRGTGGEVK